MKKLAALILLLFTLNLSAQDFLDESDKFKLEIINPYKSLKSGDTGKIITKITPNDGLTAYYKTAGTVGQALTITWETPQGFQTSALKWPAPRAKMSQFGPSFYYKGSTYFITDLSTFENIKHGVYNITQNSNITVCDAEGQCYPGDDIANTFQLHISKDTQIDPAYSELIKIAEKNQILIGSKEINATAKADGYELTLDINTNIDFGDLKSLIFVPDNSANVNEASIELKAVKTTSGYKVTFLLPTSHEVVDGISGIFTHKNGILTASIPALHFNAKIKGEVAEAKETKLTWTSDEKAEHAKLYKADSLIDFGKEAKVAEEANQSIGTVLLFAFIGGLILNLMPCVFPVLGLKVMGFVQLSGNDPKKIKLHGLAFTFGILVSMWILAGIILIIRETTPVSWGEQMGNPVFVSCIIIMLFILGLNMYGVFEIGTSMTSVGGKLQNKKGYSGSLFSGVLTTLIATPCSGPFLGPTMSYTLEQPAVFALMIFTIFALGIAFPYLLLAFAPALINKLPRPGAWMEVFKKFMAFPLFATAVFFLKAFGGQTGNNGMFWLSMALVLFGMAAWAYGTWSNPFIKKQKRYTWGFALPILIVTAAVWMTVDATKQKPATHTPEGWQQWHPGLVEHHVSKKRVVWVDYTADW